ATDCASGNDNAARRRTLIVVHFNRIWFSVAGEAIGAFRNHDLCTKFLRLRVGAACKFLSRYSRRKTKVIFNFGTRASLSAWRVRFQHQHVQPFRCTVNSSRQARWSRADDYEVAHMRLIDCFIEPETIGDFSSAWIAQHDLPATDHYWDVGKANAKTIE